MAKQTRKILVFDTETAGSLTNPLVYDIGGAVVDRSGKIYYEFHYVIEEVFADLRLMSTAYYSRKFQTYIQSIYQQQIAPIPFHEALRNITAIIDKYNVKAIAAYNYNFDNKAMSNTCNALYENKNWLNRQIEPMCIMCAACDILYTKTYIRLALERGWVTEKGNPLTNAECGYRFISGNYEFEEAHKGLDDVRIEAAILAAVYRKHLKFDSTPRNNAWKLVARRMKKN